MFWYKLELINEVIINEIVWCVMILNISVNRKIQSGSSHERT